MSQSAEPNAHASRVARSAAATSAPALVPNALTVLLVTDLAAFTPLVATLGDLQAQALIHAHNTAVRSCLRAHSGSEIAHLGDGVFAAFCSVRKALTCAAEIQAALTAIRCEQLEHPLVARIGLHAGEPLPEDGRLFGICVNTAFRICDATPAGAVLVSDVVRQLAGGHKFRWAERGEVGLPGLRSRVRLHELVWREERMVE